MSFQSISQQLKTFQWFPITFNFLPWPTGPYLTWILCPSQTSFLLSYPQGFAHCVTGILTLLSGPQTCHICSHLRVFAVDATLKTGQVLSCFFFFLNSIYIYETFTMCLGIMLNAWHTLESKRSLVLSLKKLTI